MSNKTISLPIQWHKKITNSELISLIKCGFKVVFFGFGRKSAILWEADEKGELHLASAKVIK